MDTTCFGQYGHHQVLKNVVGKLLLFIVLPQMRTYVCNMCEDFC
jgi:hypothetical protein